MIANEDSKNLQEDKSKSTFKESKASVRLTYLMGWRCFPHKITHVQDRLAVEVIEYNGEVCISKQFHGDSQSNISLSQFTKSNKTN